MTPKRTTKPLLPNPAVTAIAKLVTATVHVDRLTPDTRPASIRDALRVVAGTADDQLRMLLLSVIVEAYGISLHTSNSILDELQLHGV